MLMKSYFFQGFRFGMIWYDLRYAKSGSESGFSPFTMNAMLMGHSRPLEDMDPDDLEPHMEGLTLGSHGNGHNGDGMGQNPLSMINNQ